MFCFRTESLPKSVSRWLPKILLIWKLFVEGVVLLAVPASPLGVGAAAFAAADVSRGCPGIPAGLEAAAVENS